MKTILKNLFILTIASLSFTMCKKSDSEKKYTINGIVVKFPSRQPLPGVKVHLVASGFTFLSAHDTSYWQLRYTDTATKTPVVIIDSAISDANGKFTFTYISRNSFPEIEGIGNGYDPTYYTAILNPQLFRVTTGLINSYNNYIDTVHIDSASFFRLNMHKISTPYLNDTLFEKRSFSFFSNPYESIFLTYRSAQFGQTNSSVLDAFSYKQSDKVKIEWRYYRNGLQQSGQQTVNLTPNDTTKIDIYY